MRRHWTQEELDYLAEYWGTRSLENLCDKLGRSKSAILNKKQELGLGPFLLGSDYITLAELLRALGYKYGDERINAMTKRGFQLKTKKVGTKTGAKKYRICYIEDFWKWAEKNQYYLDLSRLEKNALGVEPDWVEQKRRTDKLNKKARTRWTKIEEDRLRILVARNKYSIKELSEMLGKQENGITRKMIRMGITDKPVYNPRQMWSNEDFEILKGGIVKGLDYYQLNDLLPTRSVSNIRSKLRKIYGTEDLDKIRGKMNGM